MLKKGIAAAALLAAASSVYAGGPEAPPPAYIGGAYVDVGLSRDDVYDTFRRDVSNTSSIVTEANRVITTVIATLPTTYRVDAGAPGWDGFVGVGYNYVWDNEWTLGAEIFGDATSAHGTQLQGSVVNSITGNSTINYLDLRAEHTFGVSLMPGYFIAPGSLYFLELGYVNSEFDLTGYPSAYTGVPNFGSQPSREVNQSGFRLGFGTNTQVGSHIAVRQEYVWETYGNFSARRADLSTTLALQGTTTTFSNTNSARVSPNISKFNLAAVYYFARQGNAPDLNTAPAHVGGNFYAGLNGSYDEDYSRADFWSNRTVATNNATQNVVTDGFIAESGLMKITGWNIGLLAGYGWNFTNRWYFGAELFGNFDDVNGRYHWNQGVTTGSVNGVVAAPVDSTANITSRLEKNWDFGAALIPGYQVSDAALLYARVGYVGADFEIRNSWVGATGLTAAQNTLLSRSRSSWLNGLQLGVGVDTLVYQNLSLRTEFNINNYGNYNLDTVINTVNAGGVTTVTTVSTHHRHIIEDQFNVALIWHFFG